MPSAEVMQQIDAQVVQPTLGGDFLQRLGHDQENSSMVICSANLLAHQAQYRFRLADGLHGLIYDIVRLWLVLCQDTFCAS